MSPSAAVEHVRVVVVGAGFAGLGTACRLLQDGVDDVVVLERGSDVGGTWRDNTYPGAACDTRSDLYSFSFAPEPGWTSRFAGQAEIHRYLRRVAREHGVLPRTRFRHELLEATWDGRDGLWHLRTDRGPLTTEVLVAGAGPLVNPRWPDLPGLAGFTGALLHSARWDDGVPLDGARVAVVGTGASAVQLVPHLQRRAARLHVFQRTPAWVVPREDRTTSARRRAVFRRLPVAQRVARAAQFLRNEAVWLGLRHERAGRLLRRRALAHLHAQVPDAGLRRALTPDYRIGCKRILLSDDFYPALTQPDVELVPHAVAEVGARHVRTADGTTREVDVLVCATGFHATDPPVSHLVRGEDGRTLAEHWAGTGMSALRGTVVAGFPSFFLLVGPNTALGHNSVVHMIEAQVGYVVQALRHQRRDGRRFVLRPSADRQRAWTDAVRRRLSRSVWVRGGCSSYYLDATGRNTTLWPGPAASFSQRLRRLDPADFDIEPAPGAELGTGGGTGGRGAPV